MKMYNAYSLYSDVGQASADPHPYYTYRMQTLDCVLRCDSKTKLLLNSYDFLAPYFANPFREIQFKCTAFNAVFREFTCW